MRGQSVDFNIPIHKQEGVKIVFVVGTKNSGKTTIAEYIVRNLVDRGYKVATVKHMHHEFTIDTEGKDTYRMRKAGSMMVVSFSPSELAILRPPGNVEEDFGKLSREMADEGFDFLIVEGFKVLSGGVPSVFRIMTCKTKDEVDYLIESSLSTADCISGVVSTQMDAPTYRGIPVVKFPDEGPGLVERILKRHL